MKMTRLLGGFAVAAAASALVAAGCGEDTLKPTPDPIAVTVIVSPAVVAHGDTALVSVIAKNVTEAKVQFGAGSSSCQLGSVVRVEGVDYPLAIPAVCTADFVPWVLDPGQERIESREWMVEIIKEDSVQVLPTGTYAVRGVAGPYRGTPTTIQVVR